MRLGVAEIPGKITWCLLEATCASFVGVNIKISVLCHINSLSIVSTCMSYLVYTMQTSLIAIGLRSLFISIHKTLVESNIKIQMFL